MKAIMTWFKSSSRNESAETRNKLSAARSIVADQLKRLEAASARVEQEQKTK